MNNNGVNNENTNVNPVLTPVNAQNGTTQQQPAPDLPVITTVEPQQPVQSVQPAVAPQPAPMPIPNTPVQPAQVPTPNPPVQATPVPVTPQENIESQPVMSQPTEQPQITPIKETPQPIKDDKVIDLSNHPQNIVNDVKIDSYQASSKSLNNIEHPLNQTEEYVPNPDDMDTTENQDEPVVIKKKSKIAPILLLIILGLGGYLFFTTKNYQNKIAKMKYNCTPVTSYKEEKELDLNSTLVQDLYGKVYTNIKEDIAQPEWDDTMKLYLAYRQISVHDKYNSNCNMFNPSLMEPYTCDDSTDFIPKAFKSDKLVLEWKKLFGEETPINLGNIKLKYACIGGYEYIPERGEYVEGFCDVQNATSYKMEKSLTKATSYRNTIVLTENVKYHPGEKMDLPEYLKSGEYIYTFRLDMNYNYVLISRVYNDKYNN